MSETTDNPSAVETDVNTALNDATVVADAAAAATANPVAASVAGGLNAADAVAAAIEAQAPHSTVIADIGAGIEALANTPIVAANSTAAGITSIASSFFQWLKSEFAKL